jgi:methyl-accepting chemotaxis protein
MAIKRSLREIGAGNLDVRLRASDSKDFGEIADELSIALSSIRRQIGAAKSELDLVDQPDTKAEDIEQVLRNCRQALDYFQVNDNASNDSKAA